VGGARSIARHGRGSRVKTVSAGSQLLSGAALRTATRAWGTLNSEEVDDPCGAVAVVVAATGRAGPTQQSDALGGIQKVARMADHPKR